MNKESCEEHKRGTHLNALTLVLSREVWDHHVVFSVIFYVANLLGFQDRAEERTLPQSHRGPAVCSYVGIHLFSYERKFGFIRVVNFLTSSKHCLLDAGCSKDNLKFICLGIAICLGFPKLWILVCNFSLNLSSLLPFPLHPAPPFSLSFSRGSNIYLARHHYWFLEPKPRRRCVADSVVSCKGPETSSSEFELKSLQCIQTKRFLQGPMQIYCLGILFYLITTVKLLEDTMS
ncbi:hypothetical protein VNO80_02181 [Phaseolus coccineus]|uniref:Uncharacterized protein n=1 Tax=Phaseolus coccineus TaxID=3886 RepID=A0AAN9NQT0_PHACN